MMKKLIPILALVLAGCQSYTWTSGVPEEMRSVAVPVFVNATDVMGLGSAVTAQVLREFQREGSLRLSTLEDCAVEVRGEVRTAGSKLVAYERQTGARVREHRFTAVAEVSVIDRKASKVLIPNRQYTAQTSYLVSDDVLTAQRDAVGRLGEDFARQIVDDVLMVLSKNDKQPSIAKEIGHE